MKQAMLHMVLVSGLLLGPAAAQAGHESHKRPDRFPSEVASIWFDRLYEVVRSEGTAPPPASRIYGISAVALYEAMAPRSWDNRSLVGQLNGLTWVPAPRPYRKYHWPVVASAALARTIRGLYPVLKPENAAAVTSLEQGLLDRFEREVPRSVLERSVEHGRDVAEAILAWADTDGYADLNGCPYAPPPVDGAWAPTPPAFNPAPLQPCWGALRPMVLESGVKCGPAGHPPFSLDTGSAFHSAARQVYEVGQALTEEQKTVATFWADNAGATGTPAGHWIAIVGQLARRRHLGLATAAEAYARVGIAVHDAFVSCWRAKYDTNLQRPVTYIRNHIDPAWTPYLVTPAFPAYTSGHSTQSGAAAQALTDMFGAVRFTDTLRADHGLVPPLAPRTFQSFLQAAREAAVSRLYGGIHYSFDNDDGFTAGRCVGKTIRKRVRFDR
jgi:PAP2 superfamily